MRKLANVLVVISGVFMIYSAVTKLTGEGIIVWGPVRFAATSGLFLSVFCMLIAVFIKVSIAQEKNIAIGTMRSLFWLGILIVFGIIVGVFLSHITSRNKKLTDQEVITSFNIIASQRPTHGFVTWMGIRAEQFPTDNWSMQEIMFEVKPDFIIETGTLYGSTSLYYATVLAQVNKDGKVLTVDIDPRVEEASKFDIFKERVEVLKGDSVSAEIINAIREKVQGKKVLVTLDSLHTKNHVLKELNLYSQFVSIGSYIVVQDTNMNGHPVLPNFGPGPFEAVEDFLKTHKNFAIDHSREKFLLTDYPSGYLKRIQ
jgi:cephalosporin hydroxylase